MISIRRRLLITLALILLVTQLMTVFWLWHESREQIKHLVEYALSTHNRDNRVDREITESIAALLVPSIVMWIVALILSFSAISWVIHPLNQLQKKLDARSADNLSPLSMNSDIQEVVSVTKAVNKLFARLESSIQQERLFTADAAHELRTPLAGVRLHLELMEQKGVEGSRALITRIDQLIITLEQLLMLARAGQNFAKGHYQQVDLAEHVLRPLQEELTDMLSQHQQRLQIHSAAFTPVHGDAVLLRLMVRNLVENAFRYSPQDSEVTITLSASPEGVLLQVDDQGPGIDENQATELTKAFKRADQRYGGSGLGLSIVMRIIQLHGGTLQLCNRRHQRGLSAKCYLPIAKLI
jgi:two-component system sensor histidine kinase BasS